MTRRISWQPPMGSSSSQSEGFEMTINISRGTTDEILEEIRTVLVSYQRDHPSARIDLYRQNSASVRVRIVDSDFSGMSKKERHNLVWKYLDPFQKMLKLTSVCSFCLPQPKSKNRCRTWSLRIQFHRDYDSNRRARVLPENSLLIIPNSLFQNRQNPRPGATR